VTPQRRLSSTASWLQPLKKNAFGRKKHWAGFPSESIAYCLREAGLSLADVDAVAINQDSKANYWKKIGYTLMKRPELKFVLDKLRNRRDREGLDVQLQKHFEDSRFAGKVYPVEHHIAHLSSTFHVSPFDEAVVVSVDLVILPVVHGVWAKDQRLMLMERCTSHIR